MNGQQSLVAGFDGEHSAGSWRSPSSPGSLQTGDDGMLVTDTKATAEGWKVGDTVTVDLPAGTATLPSPESSRPASSWVRTSCSRCAALEAGGVAPADSFVYVDRTPGADPAAVSAESTPCWPTCRR